MLELLSAYLILTSILMSDPTTNQIKNKSSVSGLTVTEALNTLLLTQGDGTGDMLKTVYDNNNNGKVDIAEVAEAVPWTGVTSKPATFPPQAHSHTALEIVNTPFGNISSVTVQTAINELDSEKQSTLVSGTNIKTINGNSLLGSGDIVISAANPVTVEDILTSTSTVNALSANQGRVLKELVDTKATVLTTREKLTSARTYYVRSDGSDSNNGLTNTSGGAFLTVQKAIDILCSIDLSIYDCTIQIADGTYTAGITLKAYVSGGGNAIISGNPTTPSNVVISTTNMTSFGGAECGKWRINGVKVQTTTAGYAFLISGKSSSIDLRNINFGPCVNGHVVAASGAFIRFNANWAISGSAPVHLLATDGSTIIATGFTCTLTGTPTLSTFASASTVSMMNLTSLTFSGSATGTRYSSTLNAVINTSGGGASYFPGDVAGSTSTGGQYA